VVYFHFHLEVLVHLHRPLGLEQVQRLLPLDILQIRLESLVIHQPQNHLGLLV
jgi:hypothetical protein